MGRATTRIAARVTVTADEIEAAQRDGAAGDRRRRSRTASPSAATWPGWRGFARLGARYLTLTHNGHNALADSAPTRAATSATMPTPSMAGSAPLGRQAIAELNRLGMLVDVAHVSKPAMLQAAACLAHAGGVHAFLHPRAVRPLRATSTTSNSTPCAMSAAWCRSRRCSALPPRRQPGRTRVTVADYADHIDYAVRRIGIEHVGISSDFDGGGGFTGWQDASESPNVTAELRRRGYDPREHRRCCGAAIFCAAAAGGASGGMMRARDVAGWHRGAGARPGHLAHGRGQARRRSRRRRRCGSASISG